MALYVSFQDKFLPDLLGGMKEKVSDLLCNSITWGVNRAGVWIPDPTQTSHVAAGGGSGKEDSYNTP